VWLGKKRDADTQLTVKRSGRKGKKEKRAGIAPAEEGTGPFQYYFTPLEQEERGENPSKRGKW